MTAQQSQNYPRQLLLFFVAQDVGEEIRFRVKNLVERLAGSREWVIRPPRFVDSTFNSEKPDVDSAVVTVGGDIELYPALPGTNLPREIDLLHLNEVEYLVEQLREFSQVNALAIELELDHIFVGAIEDGILDKTLKEGLLGEWRKHLEH
jgi:hypothetical protein